MSNKKNTDNQSGTGKILLPMLALRDTVAFPGNILPLTVGRKQSISALKFASLPGPNTRKLFLVAQKYMDDEKPGIKAIFNVGVEGKILQQDKMANGYYRVLVENGPRFNLQSMSETADGVTMTELTKFQTSASKFRTKELEVIAQHTKETFNALIEKNENIPDMVRGILNGLDDPERIFNTIANHLFVLPVTDRQKLLEISALDMQFKAVIEMIDLQLSALKIDKSLRNRVKKQMEKSQREFYLNEKMKAIQHELGDMGGTEDEYSQLENRLRESNMPENVLKKALSEFNRYKMMMPISAEASVMRNYLDWLLNVPWHKRSKLQRNLDVAKKILDRDHFGLEEVKERILEFLAVQQRNKEIRSPILCLVGPPGVGKTSLGQSVAKATSRKFVRQSLGGLRDEAEIRGHRRTYIGALPGKIIQKMAVAGTTNPLFLLDEIDKLGMDFRGDPASALLEVLDPEQNHSFNDHYLEIDYNLSEVMFIATANTLDLPSALLDRMEIIRIPGYTEDEKLSIGKNHLLPKQIKNNGIKKNELNISDSALSELIGRYTREAGVRNLEREISKICRKIVLNHTKETSRMGKAGKKNIRASSRVTPNNLAKYCGVARWQKRDGEKNNQTGSVNGLAWTSAGGEILTIEAIAVPGKARQVLTGSLGDVMKESIQIAVTVVRSQAEKLGIPRDFLENTDVHVHVPEGATPKDGPSAGTCMCVALLSALSNIPVRSDIAMTGELTLQGKVLAIGGLKEKMIAVRHSDIKTIIIPEQNRRHLTEIPDKIKRNLKIECVSSMEQILPLILEYMPGQQNSKKQPAQQTLATTH